MTSVILATVPHTGTQFFYKLLQQHFPPMGFDEVGKRGCIAVHTVPANMELIHAHRRSITLVTTLRDEAAVLNSWKQRGRDLSKWDEAWSCWRDLLELKPIIVSVDDAREARLRALERALGVEFETDWTPENAWKTH